MKWVLKIIYSVFQSFVVSISQEIKKKLLLMLRKNQNRSMDSEESKQKKWDSKEMQNFLLTKERYLFSGTSDQSGKYKIKVIKTYIPRDWYNKHKYMKAS